MIRRAFKKLVMRFLFRKLAPANKLENIGNPFAYPETRQSRKFMKKAHDAVIEQMLNPQKAQNFQREAKFMTRTDEFNDYPYPPFSKFGHPVKKSTTTLDIDIYPVIHHLNAVITLEQADIAFDAQADGVFLISHYRDDDALVPLAQQIKAKYPDKKVGLNFLTKGPQEALEAVHSAGLDMMWGDYCGVTSGAPDILAHQLDSRNHHLGIKEVFASVAFKYQAEDKNPPLAARKARGFGFIPTTSGAGTGEAPTVDKIKAMSRAVDGHLAVASGMTVENIGDYAPHLRYVLVATGVSLDDHHFDFELLYRFIALAKNTKANHLITSALVAVSAQPGGGE